MPTAGLSDEPELAAVITSKSVLFADRTANLGVTAQPIRGWPPGQSGAGRPANPGLAARPIARSLIAILGRALASRAAWTGPVDAGRGPASTPGVRPGVKGLFALP